MSDTWSDIQAFKSRQSSLKERIKRRKKEMEGLVQSVNQDVQSVSIVSPSSSIFQEEIKETLDEVKISPEFEQKLLQCLTDSIINLPIDSKNLLANLTKTLGYEVQHIVVKNFLQKFSAQGLISIEDHFSTDEPCLLITSAEHTKLLAVVNDITGSLKRKAPKNNSKLKIDLEEDILMKESVSQNANKESDLIENLLSLSSSREKETKKVGEEILELLSKPTAKEKFLVERFSSQGGTQVKKFCPHGTKEECIKMSTVLCSRLHFKKILQKHTDETLGDCSFLNTCFHMDICKFVHYEVEFPLEESHSTLGKQEAKVNINDENVAVLFPAQWIQCDLRFFDMTVLGTFSVIMADPPWDIHMELPYGTMSDDEMRQLNIPCLQEKGLIFLWVTGRAMELGRECLQLWGYERCDELIWVKTNQLQRIIRTGRTGHWVNHGKEHCLVGIKGDPDNINKGLDCDVIVAEVRATSHKPDEIYGIIERLSPGTRKIELFGRMQNVQPNWITLGNQLDGVKLIDPILIENFRQRYPDGDCMQKA